MNIAILHYSVPPVVGGVESVIAHHARLMAADGHSVRLIAARGEALSEQIPLITVPLEKIDKTVSEHKVYCQLHPKHVPAIIKVAGK